MSPPSVIPRITAVVPTYNRLTKTLRFVAQFQQQTYAHWRLVIVDANSPDGTAAQIRQAYPPDRYPHMTVLEVPNTYFWTAATNAGVAHALAGGSEYIFTVNDDAVLPPTHLADLLNLACTHNLAILGNRINYLDPPDQVWALGTYTEWGTANFLRLGHTEMPSSAIPASVLAQDVIPVDALPGNGVLLHRSVFEQIGLYQAKWLPHYHADSELIMRALQAGIPAFVAPGMVLQNDFHTSQKQVAGSQPGWLGKLGSTFFNQKSHLFLPAVLYILGRYCPPRQLPATAWALLQRLRQSADVG
jgi:GT2 family glycosyltransferase